MPGLDEREVSDANRVSDAMHRPVRLRRHGMVRLKQARELGEWRDSRVQRDKCGRYFLILAIKVPARVDASIWSSQAYGDAFLDPGGRTFHTLYSPDGVAAKMGDDFYGGMLPRLKRADRVMGAAACARSLLSAGLDDAVDRRKTFRRERRLRMRAQRLRTKVYNCVRELHRKTARFLCSNFKAIYIPRFAVGRRDSTQLARRISNGAVRNLMTFAHAEFLTTLRQYAEPRGVHVITVGESYTTKTCTFCGHQNDVGARKTIVCSACQGKADRDYAGARNIAMRTAMALE